MAQQSLDNGAADAGLGQTLHSLWEKTQGNFTELYDLHLKTSLIEINKESDFPKQDAATITLELGFGYWVKTPFITAKRFVCEGGGVTSVSGGVPFITYTGVGSMFTATQANMRFLEVAVDCPNANIFKVIGDGTNSLAFGASISGFIAFNCVSVFEGVDGGLLDILSANIINCSTSGSAISQTGSVCALMSINRVAISGLLAGGVGIDLGTTVFNEIEINNNILNGDPSVTGISGLTLSGNVVEGGVMSVSGCNYSALTTPLAGVLESDVRSSFGAGNSANLRISRNAADVFLVGGTETITTGSAGDWQEIGVPSSGGVEWNSDISERFTIGGDGVITYIGEREIDVLITGRATVEKVGGGANILEVRIAKNWTGSPSDGGLEKSRAQTQNTDPTTVPIGALTHLEFNDNIRAIFSNRNGTSNIDAMVSSLEING